MATAEILLLEPILGLGNEGDTVTVKAGYARNFLFPQKKAVAITQANRKRIENLVKRRELREANELTQAKELSDKVLNTSIAIAVKTGKGGKMFGAVTVNDLLKHLSEAGIDLERKQIHLSDPIKVLGQHRIPIKLHSEVTVELAFEVVSENPIDEPESET